MDIIKSMDKINYLNNQILNNKLESLETFFEIYLYYEQLNKLGKKKKIINKYIKDIERILFNYFKYNILTEYILLCYIELKTNLEKNKYLKKINIFCDKFFIIEEEEELTFSKIKNDYNSILKYFKIY